MAFCVIAPAGPSPQEKLLMEIRDAIKAGR
jgi:hypothetical protein